MPAPARPALVFGLTAALGLVLDQISKAVVVARVEGRPPVLVVGRTLTIAVSRNSGAAFSFAPAATAVFALLAAVVTIAIARTATRLQSLRWAVALGLVFAGAFGNLIDRLVRAPGVGRGAVVDFIDLQHFATFNIADSCITCGAVLALLLVLAGVAMVAENDQPEAQPISS